MERGEGTKTKRANVQWSVKNMYIIHTRRLGKIVALCIRFVAHKGYLFTTAAEPGALYMVCIIKKKKEKNCRKRKALAGGFPRYSEIRSASAPTNIHARVENAR